MRPHRQTVLAIRMGIVLRQAMLGLSCVVLASALAPGSAHAEDRFGEGRVLDAKKDGSKYKVKVLDPEGRVRNVEVDAPSGGRGGGSSGGSSGSSSGGSGSGGSAGGNSGGDESNEGSGGRGRGRGR